MADQRLGHPYQNTVTVPAGTSITVEITSPSIAVAAIPGGSATVEYAMIDKGANTNWFTWSQGTVSAAAIERISYYIGVVRLSATTADADFEIRILT